MKKKLNKKGFTLVELLVVLVIALILLTLVITNSPKAIERANVTEHYNNRNVIETAIGMCFTQLRAWDLCDSEDELTDDANEFLAEWPENPFGGTYDIIDHPTIQGLIVCAQSTSARRPADTDEIECGGVQPTN